MKILFHLSDKEYIQNILTGWYNALQDSGFEVRTFKNDSSPLFREIELFAPNLLILDSTNVNRAIKKAVEQSGLRVIIITERKLMPHQQIPGAKVVSDRQVEDYLVSRFGIDFVQYKDHESDDYYKCDSVYITSKKVDPAKVKGNRLYSSIPQLAVNYVGKLKDKKKVYSSTRGIYLDSSNSDIENMYFCGAKAWDLDDVCAGNCDCADQTFPRTVNDTYHGRLIDLFDQLGFDNTKLKNRLEEIKNEKDWAAAG